MIHYRERADHRADYYDARRGLRRRAGSVSSAQTNSSTPPTAIPITRNGSKSSQTIGYNTRAIRATGQEITNKRHHSRNVIIISIQEYAQKGRTVHCLLACAATLK